MAYVIGNDCIACGTCLPECPVEQSLRVIFIRLMKTLAPNAVLAQVYVPARLLAFPNRTYSYQSER